VIILAFVAAEKWYSSGRTGESVRHSKSDLANYAALSENTAIETPQEKALPPPDHSKEINEAENTPVQRMEESTENGSKIQEERANSFPRDGCRFRNQITRREAFNEYPAYKKRTESEYTARERNYRRGYTANSFSDNEVIQSVPRPRRVYVYPSLEGSSKWPFKPDRPRQNTYYHRGPVVTETPRRIIVHQRNIRGDNINVRRYPFNYSNSFTYQGHNSWPIRSRFDYRAGYRVSGRPYVIVRRWR
jgi:hypothetical protein